MTRHEAAPTRILVVDDEELVRRLLQRLLEREGYDVEVASSGEEGLERARARAPDAVLLDTFLPGMSGPEVCRALRRDAATASIPVLMLSGDDGTENVEEGLAAGASDFLVKPFDRRAVLQRLDQAIDATRT
jgi:two-component system response regulator ResD